MSEDRRITAARRWFEEINYDPPTEPADQVALAIVADLLNVIDAPPNSPQAPGAGEAVFDEAMNAAHRRSVRRIATIKVATGPSPLERAARALLDWYDGPERPGKFVDQIDGLRRALTGEN